jgi:methionine biosynthesis protein MetW
MKRKKTAPEVDKEITHSQNLARAAADLFGISAAQIAQFLSDAAARARIGRQPGQAEYHRWQDPLIESVIPEGASVLDLGCGDGELLQRLIARRRVRGQGVEIDPEAVMACTERGVPVFQADLDEGLRGFPDGSFDFVVLEETLQTLHRPLEVLAGILRVGRRAIVSFPNFAHWRVRVDLAARGRMPVTEWLPHRWYDSPNIHLFTIQDFCDWADSAAVAIPQGWVLADGEVRPIRDGDNLQAEEALLVIHKQQPPAPAP